MKQLFLATTALAAVMITTAPAHAQADDTASLRSELEAMRTEMERMRARIEQLESSGAETAQTAAQATELAQSAQATAEAMKVEQPDKPGVEIAWKGAPEISGPGGWSFKPRGRLQFDAGTINAPDSTGVEDGFGSEVRRARLGVQGDIPGGFGYKFEVDFAGGDAEIADAILTYGSGGLTVTVGQHNTFQSLEELTSSLNSSFIERAAFTDAFAFERRLGLSTQYKSGDFLLQAGAFSDNFGDIPGKSYSLDGRVVFMPRLGNAQLHLGSSIHYADLESGDAVRYRQRPLVHFTSTRFIDTGTMPAHSELGYGAEAAIISGPVHAAGEAFWQSVDRSDALPDADFFGGYVEIGYFLTGGDSRGYKNGVFDRVKPERPMGDGGFGALQVNLRYDYLDLNDGPVVGGTQDGYMASLIWTQTAYTRLMLNYARLSYRDAAFPMAGGDASYDVDTIAMRAQIDF